LIEVIELWSPLIQGGFAVFALLLLAVNVWLVKQLLKVLKDNSQVIAGNTRAIESVANIAGDTKELMQEIRDELLKRPCLMHDHSRFGRTHESRTLET
jgi:F0F1-type ATP synthase membrane subunit b/b'